MSIPRPSSDDLIAAVGALPLAFPIGSDPWACATRVALRRVSDWLYDQAELASEAEVRAQRASGRGPDGERLTTPRDADDD